MTWKACVAAFVTVAVVGLAGVARGAEAVYHHVHLAADNPEEAAQWYIRHMGCEVMLDRTDRCQFGTMYLAFRPGPAEGGSDGSAVNHIGLSFADLAAKMQELEAAGVTIVTPLREAPGLFKLAFVEDPWGTRIEVVEDPASLGFHHVHLRSANPEATLAWYHTLLGGQRATLKGRLDGLLYGKAWLLATRQTEGRVAPSEGRAIDHLAFAVANLERAAADIREQGVQFTREPWVLENGPFAKASTIISPDGVRVEVVEPFQP